MDSLVHWRTSALEKRASGDALRPVSPPPLHTESHLNIEEPTFEYPTEQKVHGRSKSEPPSAEDIRRVEEEDGKAKPVPDQGQNAAPKPTSSSWVNWWSRSRRKEGYSVLDSVRKRLPAFKLELILRNARIRILPLRHCLYLLPTKS